MSALRCPLGEAAVTSPREPAVVGPDGTVSYGELDQYVTATAQNLVRAGCRAGERVALLLPAQWHSVVLLAAAFRAGAVACLLDPDGGPAAVGYAIRALGCGRLIAPPPWPARPELTEPPRAQRHAPEELIAFMPAAAVAPGIPELPLDRDATVHAGVDGAGRPAYLVHSLGSHYYGARGANHALRISSHNRWLFNVPFHDGRSVGLVFRCLVGGAALVMSMPGEKLAAAVLRYGVTHVALDPVGLEALLADAAACRVAAGLKAIQLHGGQAVPALRRRARAAGLPVVATYDPPAVSSPVCMIRPETPPSRQDTAGQVLKYREVRVTDRGAIEVRGAALFRGYAEGDGVRRPLDAEGWFATGDRGALDADGYLAVNRPPDSLAAPG